MPANSRWDLIRRLRVNKGDKTAPFYFRFTSILSTVKYLSNLSCHGFLYIWKNVLAIISVNFEATYQLQTLGSKSGKYLTKNFKQMGRDSGRYWYAQRNFMIH